MESQKVLYDYNSEIDILHIYSQKIEEGVKGCIQLGEYSLDIGKDNSIVGIEIEEASKLLNINLRDKIDEVRMIIRKAGNSLVVGFIITKNEKESTFQFSLPYSNSQILKI